MLFLASNMESFQKKRLHALFVTPDNVSYYATGQIRSTHSAKVFIFVWFFISWQTANYHVLAAPESPKKRK